MQEELNRQRLNKLLIKLESQNDVLDKLLKKIKKDEEGQDQHKSKKVERKK